MLLAFSGTAGAQGIRLDLDEMNRLSDRRSARRELTLPVLDLVVGAETGGVADVAVVVGSSGGRGADGRYDSPLGKYRVVRPPRGVAVRQGDGGQRIEIGTRIEVLSETSKTARLYEITLVTSLVNGSSGDVIIEGARIDPEDPEGKRTVDPFRMLLPAPDPR
jgi:hypothetical protein